MVKLVTVTYVYKNTNMAIFQCSLKYNKTTGLLFIPPLGCLTEGNPEIPQEGQTRQSHQSFLAQLELADFQLGISLLFDHHQLRGSS